MGEQNPAVNGKPSRLQSSEAWGAFLFRIASFVSGLAILNCQAFGLANDGWLLTVAAVGLCGPVTAAAAGSFFESIRGGSAK